jgi:hypothetical protein
MINDYVGEIRRKREFDSEAYYKSFKDRFPDIDFCSVQEIGEDDDCQRTCVGTDSQRSRVPKY